LPVEHFSAWAFHPYPERERFHADFYIRRIMMSISIIIIQVVLSLLFVAIGSMTVAGRKMFVENFRRFGYPQWFRVVTGSLEVLGGLGLLVGIWLPWLAALASAGLALVMLGAVFTQVRTKESWQRVVVPFVVGVLVIVVAVSYWPTVLHL
jgi:putative oxidoreductase